MTALKEAHVLMGVCLTTVMNCLKHDTICKGAFFRVGNPKEVNAITQAGGVVPAVAFEAMQQWLFNKTNGVP